jgi:hypothetical protein
MYAVSVCSATLVAFFVFFESLDCKMSLMSFSLAFPNLEVEELATAILLVRPNCKQTDDNVTFRKSCFPFSRGTQWVVYRETTLQTLTAYIIEADKDVNLCDCSPKQLAELLRNFYIDVRKKNGTSYKLSALKSISCA